MQKSIHVFGPPGSGKGTQANLIADNLNATHLDTGKYLEGLIKEGSPLIPEEEKVNFDEGRLVDPVLVLSLVKQRTEEIKGSGSSVVYSGSPRTVFEAFGDSKTQGLMDFLSNLYGKENLLIFKLSIPKATSIERNSKRLVCTKCKETNPYGNAEATKCIFCGGELYKRTLDDPIVIETRLKEYDERTDPVMKGLHEGGYRIIDIDGTPKPDEVFESIKAHLQ